MTQEERELIVKMVEHAGCNCGEGECFTPEEMETALKACEMIPVSLYARMKISRDLARKLREGVH